MAALFSDDERLEQLKQSADTEINEYIKYRCKVSGRVSAGTYINVII